MTHDPLLLPDWKTLYQRSNDIRYALLAMGECTDDGGELAETIPGWALTAARAFLVEYEQSPARFDTPPAQRGKYESVATPIEIHQFRILATPEEVEFIFDFVRGHQA